MKMKVEHNTRVETTVNWVATITIDRDEFDDLLDDLENARMALLATSDSPDWAGEVAEALHFWRQTLLTGAPDEDGPKRPITELKRKAREQA